jgi:hypothetical protein
MGLPVFPIKIRLFRQKWEKLPLTPHGHLDASLDTSVFDWSKANGFGIAMGKGWYCLDVDAHKPGVVDGIVKWISDQGIEKNTRQHKTPSGGWHLIYRLPEGWENLRTRANVIPGLDTRGNGGWIAFGHGYKVIRDIEPAVLPASACRAMDEGSSGQHQVVLKGYNAPSNPLELKKKLQKALVFGPNMLKHRWKGSTLGLVDKSGSAMDHSVGKLLAMYGFTEDEIVWVLLNEFEHGSARDKGNERVALRAAGRTAAKGRMTTDQERAELTGFKEPEVTPEIEEQMKNFLRSRT